MTSRKDAAEERDVGRMTFSCEVKDGAVRFSNATRQFLPPDGKRFIEWRGESVHP